MSSPEAESGGRGGAGHSHELQIYEACRYMSDPGQIRNEKRIVIAVHFIAQTILQSGGNRWTMFLQTGPKSSVRINMDPTTLRGARVPGHGYRGEMGIIHRPYGSTRNRHAIVSMPAVRGRSAAHFIDTIINAGNHEYDFTTEGRGCTGWMIDQYRLFLQQGLIQPGFDAIEEAINLQWVEGRPTSTRGTTRGFYMRETRGGGWSRTSGANARRTRPKNSRR